MSFLVKRHFSLPIEAFRQTLTSVSFLKNGLEMSVWV